MGQSTNAILFYGYCLGEDVDVEDWEEKLAKAKGLVEPTVPYPSREGCYVRKEDYTPEEAAAAKEHSNYWAAKRELVAAGGVEIDSHCSCDYPMHYVHISKAEKMAHRGDEVEIAPGSLAVEAEWVDQLKDFCKTLGLKIEGEPKWFLVSKWC